ALRAIRSFANAFEPSIAAAGAIGPNTARPASRRRSARPATSGASGPTTVRSIRSRRANATRPSSASAASGTHTAWRAMPGLPGAVKSALARGRRRRHRTGEVAMDVVHPKGAGLDVHQQPVVACARVVSGASVHHEVRTFGTTTQDLLALSDWLTAHGCTHVAMESSGVYW